MDQQQSVAEFLVGQVLTVSLWTHALNLALCIVFAYLLAGLYVFYGQTISNRRAFARNFPLVAVATLLVISIVQSSIALSLGLIGALSIVRFRAAIKEPEELVYLFLSIAMGLGFGSGQRGVTIVSFLAVAVVVYVSRRLRGGPEQWKQNSYLAVSTDNPELIQVGVVQNLLKEHCNFVRTKRIDRQERHFEAFFLVECRDSDSFERIEGGLRELDASVTVSFLDHRGGSLAAP
jgi:uncharacterized membrane protein YhiD involved in acid resistance